MQQHKHRSGRAYVGNITGSVALRDSSNISIYDWALTTVTGEVYASRNASINWSGIRCITNATLGLEESDLSINTLTVDSVNQTFNNTIHAEFQVGTTTIGESTCRAIATYVNNTAQAASPTADFQEIALDDTRNSVVYATILENNVQGYNNEVYDFQLIVPEDPTTTTANAYYFWAELG